MKYFLGIEFARSRKVVFVSPRTYVLDLLGETGLIGCKETETPIEPNLKLRAASAKEVVDQDKYQRLVGKLNYLSHTHLDIAFAVSMVRRFTHSPGSIHFEAVCRIKNTLRELLEKVFYS